MGLLGDIVNGFVQSNPIGQAINAGVSMINGAFDRHAQKESNKRNAEQNELNREFSANQAQLDRDFNAQQSDKQNAFNAEQSQIAFDRQTAFQREMWNKENEYNSPKAQIERLVAAGVNPNLFGGDNTAGSVGSVSSAPASGSPASHGSVGAPSSIPNQPLSYTNPLLEAAQIRLANANADNAERTAERTKALLPGELKVQGLTLNLGAIDARLKESEIDSIKSKMKVDQSSIKQMDEQTNNLIKQGRLLELDVKQREIFLKQYEDRLVTELMQMKSKLRLDEWNIKHIASQIALNASQANLNSMNTANAYDIHLMNGIELQYKGKMLKLAYDKESNDYALSLLEGKKETRIKEFRANDSNELYRFVNGALDDVEIITRMAGNIFGSMPDYIKKK